MKDESGTTLQKCPKCETDDELSIDSCGSLCRSEVQCSCGYTFQHTCFEENIGKYWNKHIKNYQG